MNILLVDDEIHTIKGIQAAIDCKKYQVETIYSATNIRKAMEIFQQTQIDLLICDIELPQGSGLDLLSWLNEQRKSVISALLTCHAEFDYARRAIGLGVVDYLLKPITDEQLDQLLNKTFRVLAEAKDYRLEIGETFVEGRYIKNGIQNEVQNTLVLSMLDYIELNIADDITREKLADHFHFSPDYLSRLFKSETGVTLQEHFLNRRMEMAKNLLINSDMPISDIVSFIGYSNFSHFSKSFKKLTGVTPLKYRHIKNKPFHEKVKI